MKGLLREPAQHRLRESAASTRRRQPDRPYRRLNDEMTKRETLRWMTAP